LQLFTFSIGLRRCVGYELAWLELYLGAAAFLRNFDGEITTSTKGMAMRDFYTACVAEGKMMANLERRI
jgi:cytochrome P450